MALCELRWSSNFVGKQVGTYVILPDGGTPPFPTFYLLHGRSDDYTIWLRRTRIEMYAAEHPFIIVMPDGFLGYYTDNDLGPAYARYIGEELPSVIERYFPAMPTRQGRCIGGLSMGGYGALRVALKYPDRFASANSHSGAMMIGSNTFAPSRFPEGKVVFGENPRNTEHDLMRLARDAKASGMLPKMRIDCGVNDFLLQDNRTFHQFLQESKIEHEYEEFPGDHNWDYWDLHIREALAFHARNFKLPQA